MEILIDGIMYSLKKSGGVGRYFKGFLPLLSQIDPQVKVKLFLHPKLSSKLDWGKSIKIVRVPKAPGFFPRSPGQFLISPLGQQILKNYWSKKRGDIFHSTYYTRHPQKDMAQVVTVYDMIHELFPQYFSGLKNDLFRKRKKKIVQLADAVICISENTKKDLLRFYKIDKKRVFIVYPGKDKIFKKIRNQKMGDRFRKKYKLRKPFLLYLGPRGHYKNFAFLAKTFSLWQKRGNYNLVVLGGDQFSQKEKENLRQWGIEDKVLNFGYVSDRDLVLFYNYCHAFIVPSLVEGFGIPLIEAASCGALVLCSQIGVFKEVLGRGAIFFNPQEAKSLIKALEGSCQKNKRKVVLQQALKESRNFSWQRTARKTIEVYQRALLLH